MYQKKKYSRYCFVPVIALAKKLKTGNNSYSKNILKILINSNRGRQCKEGCVKVSRQLDKN